MKFVGHVEDHPHPDEDAGPVLGRGLQNGKDHDHGLGNDLQLRGKWIDFQNTNFVATAEKHFTRTK